MCCISQTQTFFDVGCRQKIGHVPNPEFVPNQIYPALELVQ